MTSIKTNNHLKAQCLTLKLIILFLYQSLSKQRQILLEYSVSEDPKNFFHLDIHVKTNLTLKNYEINKILVKVGGTMGIADFARLSFVFNHKKYKAKFPKHF